MSNIYVCVCVCLFRMEPLSAAHARFCLSLFQKISDGDSSQNVFFSPLSISAALSMLSLGAAGNTKAQMSQTLHFAGAESQIHAGFMKLLSEMSRAGAPHTLSLASRLYGEQSCRFQETFLSDTRRLYGAELQPLDFISQPEASREIINRWVEQQTHEKIRDLLTEGSVDSLSRLVLVNAVYFKSSWERKFQEEHTHEQQFRTSRNESKPVQMMFQKGRFPLAFIPDVNCQILELPYAGKELSMLVLLPNAMEDDGTGLEKLERALTLETLTDWTRSDMMDVLEVEVSLPRLRVEERLELKPLLVELGMPDAFDPQRADFSGVCAGGELLLSTVVHQSFLEVNEEGTVAAAATAAVMMTRCLMRAERFCADHPFLMLIRHNPTGSLLFYGRVCKP